MFVSRLSQGEAGARSAPPCASNVPSAREKQPQPAGSLAVMGPAYVSFAPGADTSRLPGSGLRAFLGRRARFGSIAEEPTRRGSAKAQNVPPRRSALRQERTSARFPKADAE